MNESYEVIDRDTNKAIPVRSLYDSNGNYKPHDPIWQASYFLRELGTLNEVVIEPATDNDELEEIADELSILADRIRQITDKGDDDE